MSEVLVSDDLGLPLRAMLLRTPFGVFVLGIFGSIPAAALTVGVRNWGDLGQRLPWWAGGVLLVLTLALVLLGITAHPVARRLAAWTVGWVLVSVSSPFAFAIAWTIVFNPSALEDTAAAAISLLAMLGLAAIGVLLIRRRVRDATDTRIEKTVLLAKDLLLPDEDRTGEILDSLKELRADLKRFDAGESSSAPPRDWHGPGWAHSFCVRRGWLLE